MVSKCLAVCLSVSPSVCLSIQQGKVKLYTYVAHDPMRCTMVFWSHLSRSQVIQRPSDLRRWNFTQNVAPGPVRCSIVFQATGCFPPSKHWSVAIEKYSKSCSNHYFPSSKQNWTSWGLYQLPPVLKSCLLLSDWHEHMARKLRGRTGSVITNHSLGHYKCFSPKCSNYEGNTTFNLLSHLG